MFSENPFYVKADFIFKVSYISDTLMLQIISTTFLYMRFTEARKAHVPY